MVATLANNLRMAEIPIPSAQQTEMIKALEAAP
jgi:hypothetical protein